MFRSMFRWGRAVRPLLILLLLCGCAPKAPQIAFTPAPQPAAAAPGSAEKLENLPQALLLERGEHYLAQGNLALARLHFVRALVKDPGAVPAWVGQGRVALEEGDLPQAEQAFQRALELAPENPEALLGAGRVARLQGRLDVALDYLRTLLRGHPDHVAALTELGICADAGGDVDQAETALRRVTVLRPQQAAAFNNLGFNLLLQQRYAEAAEVLRRALQLAPEQGRIRNNLAAALILAGEENRGLLLFRESLGAAAAFNNAGYLHLSQAHWNRAQKAFARALDLSPVYYARAEQNLAYLQLLQAQGAAPLTGASSAAGIRPPATLSPED